MSNLEGIINRLDGMAQQLALLHLRQTELENQIRSSRRLWKMLVDREDDIRPDSRVEIEVEGQAGEESGDLVSGL